MSTKDGGQAPPPDETSRNKPIARPAAETYQRHLPHIQRPGDTLFITFATAGRMLLSPGARDLMLEHLLHDHTIRYDLHAAVVMPDHVHVLLTPLTDASGGVYGLAEIMQALKGCVCALHQSLARAKGCAVAG